MSKNSKFRINHKVWEFWSLNNNQMIGKMLRFSSFLMKTLGGSIFFKLLMRLTPCYNARFILSIILKEVISWLEGSNYWFYFKGVLICFLSIISAIEVFTTIAVNLAEIWLSRIRNALCTGFRGHIYLSSSALYMSFKSDTWPWIYWPKFGLSKR